MDLRHLRYFVAVAEELSFSKAAKRLHISQPPLSQQIKDLEGETGLQLFDRSRRKIILTAAGRDFLTDARSLLDGATRLERKVQLRAEGRLGSMTIGVNMTLVPPHTFATMLRSFQRGNPGIQFSLVDHHSVHQIDALVSGEIDVGFLRPPFHVPVSLAMHSIQREAMRLAVPIDHSLTRKRRIRWGDMARESFILVHPDIARNFYDEFYSNCRKAGFEPHIRQYVGNLSTQLWLISAGLGISPMPVTPETSSGVASIALPSGAPIYEIAMAWRKDDLSPIIQSFVNFVRGTDVTR